MEVLGLRSYKVCVQDFGNMIWKRHADQIMHIFSLKVKMLKVLRL